MSKATKAFETKIEVFLTQKIGQELMQFENMSACAGIKADSELQKKARINHFGGALKKTVVVQRQFAHLEKVDTGGRIPPRPFIDKAIPGPNTESMRAFEDMVVDTMSGGRARVTGGVPPVNKLHAKLAGGRRGPYRILLRVAKEMKQNQIDALWAASPENAPSTEDRKGFNQPLYWSGELVGGIRHWVE